MLMCYFYVFFLSGCIPPASVSSFGAHDAHETASEFHILYAQLEEACGHAHGHLVAFALAQQRLPNAR